MRILLVEDEKRLADALAYIIKKNNYIVDVANNGLSALDYATSGIYDLIILDRILPELDGIDILKAVRRKSNNVPVIFLTAKDSVRDRIEGLDAGADDYLIKPFSTDELMARIRAIGRRDKSLFIANEMTIGALRIRPRELEVHMGAEVITLTLREMQLLELLTRNRGQTIEKEQILDRVWGFDSEAETANVELYIHYLRKKIPFSRAGLEIKTVRGVGYSLVEGMKHV